MVHPLFTVLFDLFLIGSAAGIIAAMVAEYRSARTPAIGWRRRQAPARPRPLTVGGRTRPAGLPRRKVARAA